jgi:hypothetical protein
LLESIQPGLLGPHIAPLRKRLESLLGKGRFASAEIWHAELRDQVAQRLREAAEQYSI